MTLLPIVERELRTRSRQALTYWSRGILGGVAILLCLLQLTYAEVFLGTSAPGTIVFRSLAIMAFALCSCGFLLTADSLSRERRDKTLGLLLLTSVSSKDVLAGKLLSALLSGATALLAFVPVLMLAVLTGGVTGGETWLTALMLGNALFISTVIGVWASARCSEWFAAFRLALGCLLGCWFLPLTVDRLLHLDNAFSLLSPVQGIVLASQNETLLCGASLGLGQLIAWMTLFGAGRAMQRLPAEEGAPPVPKSVLNSKPSETSQVSVGENSRHCQLAERDPIAWLLRRQRGVLGMIWIAIIILATSQWNWLLWSRLGAGVSVWLLVWPLNLAISALVGALIAWAASRFFFESRRSGEMEMLLTTPVGAVRIISAHWIYLKRLLRWPIGLMVLLVIARYTFWSLQRGEFSGLALPVILAISSCAYVIVGIVALCWAAMYFGSRSRSQLLAVAQSVGLINGVPYLLSMLWATFASRLIRFTVSGTIGSIHIQLIYSLLPNLIIITFWIIVVRRLRHRLLTGHLGGADFETNWWPPTFLRGKTWRGIRHWTPSS